MLQYASMKNKGVVKVAICTDKFEVVGYECEVNVPVKWIKSKETLLTVTLAKYIEKLYNERTRT